MDKRRCIKILTSFIMTGLSSPDKSKETLEKIEALKYAKKCVEEDDNNG